MYSTIVRNNNGVIQPHIARDKYYEYLEHVQTYYAGMEQIFKALNDLRQTEEFWKECRHSSGPSEKIRKQLSANKAQYHMLQNYATTSLIWCSKYLQSSLLSASVISYLGNKQDTWCQKAMLKQKQFILYIDYFNITAFSRGKIIKLDIGRSQERYGMFMDESKGFESTLDLTNKYFKQPPNIDQEGKVNGQIYFVSGQDAVIRPDILVSDIMDAWKDLYYAIRKMPDSYYPISKKDEAPNQNRKQVNSQLKLVVLRYFGETYPTLLYFQQYKQLIAEGLQLIPVKEIQIELMKYNYDLTQLFQMPMCQLYHGLFNLEKMLKQVVIQIRLDRLQKVINSNSIQFDRLNGFSGQLITGMQVLLTRVE